MAKHKRAELVDPLRLRGMLEYEVRNAENSELVQKGKKENVVTGWGRGWALARLTPGSNTCTLKAIALGSVSAAAASNDTAMGGYFTIRTIATNSTTLTSNTTGACTFAGAVSFAASETWSNSSQIGEFALYNSNATNDAAACMFNHINTAAYIVFNDTNTLAVTITITN